MPELTEVSKHIMIEETKQGLNIEIVDQDGRSMFPEGAKEPYERTRRHHPEARRPAEGDAVPDLDHRPHVGEPQLPPQPGYGPWNLSADRANAVRQILEEQGYPSVTFLRWWPARPTPQPLFPDDPYHRRQSPRHHHADARGAAGSAGFQAVISGLECRRSAIRLVPTGRA